MTAIRSVPLSSIAKIDRVSLAPGKIQSGTSYLGLEHIESGGRILGAQQVHSGELKSSKFRFTPQHILYGKLRPYLAKIALPDFGGICSTDIIPVLPGPDIDRKYLLYFLRQDSMVEHANSRSSGANLPRISPKELASFQVPLPPLEEQKRIAKILDAADALRAKRRESLAQLDALLQSAFLDLFGDPIVNSYGWKMSSVGDLLESVNYGTSKKANVSSGRYAILRMGNITYEGGWDMSSMKYIDLEDKEKEKYLVRKGDILFNRTNSRELVGKTAVYRFDEPMAFAGYLVRARASEKADPEYIAAFMNSPQTKSRLVSMCKSIVGMANINAKEFQTIPIPIPPLDLQERFAAIVEAVLRQKLTLYGYLEELDVLFSSLQQRAFSGEL